MKNLLLLISIFTLQHVAALAQSNCTYTDNGTSTTYSLNQGEVLCINAGTFTGVINALPSDAEIRIAAGATFNPTAMFNAAGLLTNNGTITLNTTNSLQDGFSIVNDSAALVEINASQSLLGSIHITNDKNGDILILPAMSFTNGSTISNEGVIRCNNNFSADYSTIFSNDGIFFVYGDLNIGGTSYNGGILKVYGFSTLANTSTFINKCTYLSENTLTNNSAKFENYGYIQVFATDSSNTTNRLVNNTELYNDENGIIQTTMFDNNSNVIGGGQFIALGETSNNGSFGFDGGGINFYDATPTNTQVFDDQSMSPHVSVSRLQVGAFDTTYISSNCNKMAFPLTAINTTLPVLLKDFTVINKECTPVIEWSTSQEINSNYFELERKAEKETGFTRVATINAHINSNVQNNYSFTDQHLENGKYQYRLKMVDIDGQFSYSRVTSINMFCGDESNINLYPNPANNIVNITMKTNDDDTYRIMISDIMGRVVYTSSNDFTSGMNTLQLPISHIPSGQYITLITNSIKTETIKFTKN